MADTGGFERAPVVTAHASTPHLSVVHPGLLATVQDLGRPGLASRGIALSGALDRGALRIANRLLGNAEGAAGLEITMGGFSAMLGGLPGDEYRGRGPAGVWISLTGAQGDIAIDGHSASPYRALHWPYGTRLDINIPTRGVRTYLAVRGGVNARMVAGSRATDVMAGLGRAPLAAGDTVEIGGAAIGLVPPNDLAPWGGFDERVDVALRPGPRADWFAASAFATLFDAAWQVANDSNRVGMRLDGPVLERVHAGELPSEGMVVGAVQVPPSGLPTVLLADGPVTGGYPVIAVVAQASIDRLAQARPGQRVSFRHASP